MLPERNPAILEGEQYPTSVKQTPAEWARDALDRAQAPEPLMRTELARAA